MTPLLSILTPTITDREELANKTFRDVESMCAGHPIEVLMLRDNRSLNMGEKRNALLRAASGKYVAFLDDDDEYLEAFVPLVLPELNTDVDVVTFDQEAIIDGVSGRISCRLGNHLEPWRADGVSRRPPWFWCCWRRELAAGYKVPNSFVQDGVTYHEDVLWLRHLWLEAKTESHIPKVLHRYNFSSTGTTLQK